MQDAEPSTFLALIFIALGVWSVIFKSFSFRFGGNTSDPTRRGRRFQLQGTGARIAGIGLILAGGGILAQGSLQIPGFEVTIIVVALVFVALGFLIHFISQLKSP